MSSEKYRVVSSDGYERGGLSLAEANALVARMEEKIRIIGVKSSFVIIRDEIDLTEGE